ncbi:MAG: hypothetical protein ACFFD2_03795, partial [Promethearchaeota archaeon]
KKKLAIMVIFVSFLLGFLMQPAVAANESISIDSLNRTIQITYNKIITVTDDYIFLNLGDDPLSSIIIEIPCEFESNIASFEILGNNSEKLTFKKLPYDGSDFIKWRVYLNKPLISKNTISITNRVDFIGLTLDSATPAHVLLSFVKFPSAVYDIQDCSVTITCDQAITVFDETEFKHKSTLKLAENIVVLKNNITHFDISYNLTEPSTSYTLASIKFPKIEREIRVDLWGYIYITEKHIVEHFGPQGNFRVTKYTFNVPLDAADINVFDKFGSLSFSVNEETTKNVSIDFAASRYTLRYGESTYYWLTYRIPVSDYIQRNGDKAKINIDILFGKFPWLVENFDISLILPKETSLNYVLPASDSISTTDNCITLIFNETDVTSYNSNSIKLEFDTSKSYFNFLSRPLIFILILSILCSSYVVIKRVFPLKEGLLKRETVVPTPILLEFCSLFEEKVSLVSEIEKLDEDLKKRKIKKRIYRSQRKTAEKKIIELNKDIDELKITLKKAGGRFTQIVNELEINEAERQSAKDGLYNLEQRYLRKKISIVAYQKLIRDLNNRHKRSKTRIDKLLFELREILS